MESPVMRYAEKAKRAVSRSGYAFRMAVRKLLFSAIRWVDKDIAATASLAPAATRATDAMSVAVPETVTSAVVINSEDAVVTPEIYEFYLRGIFSSPSHRQRARTLLPSNTVGRSFVELDH